MENVQTKQSDSTKWFNKQAKAEWNCIRDLEGWETSMNSQLMKVVNGQSCDNKNKKSQAYNANSG